MVCLILPPLTKAKEKLKVHHLLKTPAVQVRVHQHHPPARHLLTVVLTGLIFHLTM